MKVSGNLVVGKKDVDPSAPSHVPGVHQGNWPARSRRRARRRGSDPALTGDPRRSTGIHAGPKGTIDPRMPKLTAP